MTTSLSGLALQDFSTLTLVSGVVTATRSQHIIAAESDTSPLDDIDTITAGQDNQSSAGITFLPWLVITADTGDTITIKHGTGNIYVPGESDVVLTENNQAFFYYNGTNWRLFNVVGQAVTFTVTNWTEDLALDCDAAAVAETNDVLGTLIKTLSEGGFLDGDVSA